ncbi:MAG: HdeD family acid-resistance protein [Vicinamibacteria bacterium]
MLGKLLSEYWWVLLLRGILAIAFGVTAYAWPGLTLATLVIFFAAWVFVDGVFDVFHGFAGRKDNENWWLLLLEGLLGIAFGVITFQAPQITALILLLYIAFWAIATGVLRIVMAIRLRKEIEGEWWMALGGLASVLFGVIMVARPGAGALAVILFIAAWSIVVGTFMVILSFKARSFGKAAVAATS